MTLADVIFLIKSILVFTFYLKICNFNCETSRKKVLVTFINVSPIVVPSLRSLCAIVRQDYYQ